MVNANKTYKYDNVNPLFESTIAAGFPSPAESYVERNLNLHDHLVRKPAATFFVRVSGHSMINVGIYNGDLLIVDRSVEPRHRSIVVAVVNGEFTLKRLIKRNGRVFLSPENPECFEIEITEGMQFEIWGVALHNIHDLGSV